MPRNRLPMTMK